MRLCRKDIGYDSALYAGKENLPLIKCFKLLRDWIFSAKRSTVEIKRWFRTKKIRVLSRFPQWFCTKSYRKILRSPKNFEFPRTIHKTWVFSGWVVKELGWNRCYFLQKKCSNYSKLLTADLSNNRYAIKYWVLFIDTCQKNLCLQFSVVSVYKFICRRKFPSTSNQVLS